jgi:hypothetical protein
MGRLQLALYKNFLTDPLTFIRINNQHLFSQRDIHGKENMLSEAKICIFMTLPHSTVVMSLLSAVYVEHFSLFYLNFGL